VEVFYKEIFGKKGFSPKNSFQVRFLPKQIEIGLETIQWLFKNYPKDNPRVYP